MAMGGSSKGGGGYGNSNRGRPYGMMLLLALGAAIFGVMVLHKFRERRIFNLLIQDKDRHILSLHLLLQKERDATREVKRKVEALKAKTFTLRLQKTQLSNKLVEMQSLTSSLKEEHKELESELGEKQNEIKMLRERERDLSKENSPFKDQHKELESELEEKQNEIKILREREVESSNETSLLKEKHKELETALQEKQNEIKRFKENEIESSEGNSQVTALTEILKQKEAEIEDLKGRLEKPTNIWSVSTDDPSNPPVNLTRGVSSNVENRAGESEGQEDAYFNEKQSGKLLTPKMGGSQDAESAGGIGEDSEKHGKSRDMDPEELEKSQDGDGRSLGLVTNDGIRLGMHDKLKSDKSGMKTKRRRIISQEKSGDSKDGLGEIKEERSFTEKLLDPKITRMGTKGEQLAENENPQDNITSVTMHDKTGNQGVSELEASSSRYYEGSNDEDREVVTKEETLEVAKNSGHSEGFKEKSENTSMGSSYSQNVDVEDKGRESTNADSNQLLARDGELANKEGQDSQVWRGLTRSNSLDGNSTKQNSNEVLMQAEDQEGNSTSVRYISERERDTSGNEELKGLEVADNHKEKL